MSASKIVGRLIFSTMFFLGQLCAASSDRFLTPPNTKSWWVSQGSVHNGQIMYIKRFESNQSVDGVIEFYKTRWESGSDIPGYMESSANGWRMISQLDERQQWVVQIRSSQSGTGSEGMISRMLLNEFTSNSSTTNDKFTPMMAGGELISATYSDSPSDSKTQTQLFSGRASSVANQMKHHMQGRGWDLQDEYSYKDSITQRFERPQRKLDVALVGISGVKTLVFVNEVTHASK